MQLEWLPGQSHKDGKNMYVSLLELVFTDDPHQTESTKNTMLCLFKVPCDEEGFRERKVLNCELGMADQCVLKSS